MAPTRRAARVAVISEPIRKSVYEPGEWVWCEWKKIYYKARILERGIENDGQYYNIHYWKFSKMWDMPVSELKMFPVMIENTKWVKKHNKRMRKEIKEMNRARDIILSYVNKGLPPKETPPFLNIEKMDVTPYLKEKKDSASSNHEDGKVNHDCNGTASTSRENEMSDKHSEPRAIDGNDCVNGLLLNTEESATVSSINHNDSEMNLKCENIAVPEVDITADVEDQNAKEVNISSFHETESDIENISRLSQNTNDSSKLDKWCEEVQADPELQSNDNTSELKQCNISVSLSELGSNSTAYEQHDLNEKDLNSMSTVKVIPHNEIENNTYSSQNGSTQILKRKRTDQNGAKREKKKRRKRKHVFMNNHLDLADGNCHIIKSNKLCSTELINNKNNEKSIDGEDLAEESNIDTQFGNMINPEDDSLADDEGNDQSTKEAATLQIMNTTTLIISNNENKMTNIDDSSSAESDLKIKEYLKIEKDLKVEKDLKIERNLKIEKDLKLEASTSSITAIDGNYECEMITSVIESSEDDDLNIEESSSLSVTISEENDENLINMSCKSTQDDGEYTDNVQVMNEVKIDDIDENFLRQYGFDKPYSRAAKQKATEAILLMSKTVNKDKKSEGCSKKSKMTKKKDDDEPTNVIKLIHNNYNFNTYVLQIFIQDYHLVIDDRYIPIVPSRLTVYDILFSYTKHSSADSKVFSRLVHVFECVFESLILYPIERPKHAEIVRKHPGVLMSHLYGLPHLSRFIFYLPGVFSTISQATQFTSKAVHFVHGLTNFICEEELELTMDLYENTMPEYVRRSFLPYL